MGLFTRKVKDNATAPAGSKGRKKSRRSKVHAWRNSYPVTPEARRALNTRVNDEHASMPDGWVSS